MDNCCITNPNTVAANKTHNSLYFATVPDCRSLSMFPGSRYAMDIRKPGPVKAHNLRKLNPVWANKKIYINWFLMIFQYKNNLLFLSLVSWSSVKKNTYPICHLLLYAGHFGLTWFRTFYVDDRIVSTWARLRCCKVLLMSNCLTYINYYNAIFLCQVLVTGLVCFRHRLIFCLFSGIPYGVFYAFSLIYRFIKIANIADKFGRLWEIRDLNCVLNDWIGSRIIQTMRALRFRSAYRICYWFDWDDGKIILGVASIKGFTVVLISISVFEFYIFSENNYLKNITLLLFYITIKKN